MDVGWRDERRRQDRGRRLRGGRIQPQRLRIALGVVARVSGAEEVSCAQELRGVTAARRCELSCDVLSKRGFLSSNVRWAPLAVVETVLEDSLGNEQRGTILCDAQEELLVLRAYQRSVPAAGRPEVIRSKKTLARYCEPNGQPTEQQFRSKLPPHTHAGMGGATGVASLVERAACTDRSRCVRIVVKRRHEPLERLR